MMKEGDGTQVVERRCSVVPLPDSLQGDVSVGQPSSTHRFESCSLPSFFE